MVGGICERLRKSWLIWEFSALPSAARSLLFPNQYRRWKYYWYRGSVREIYRIPGKVEIGENFCIELFFLPPSSIVVIIIIFIVLSSDNILSTFHMIFYLWFQYRYYNFTDEETQTQRLSCLEVTVAKPGLSPQQSGSRVYTRGHKSMAHQPDLAHYLVLYGLQAKEGFYFFKWLYYFSVTVVTDYHKFL